MRSNLLKFWRFSANTWCELANEKVRFFKWSFKANKWLVKIEAWLFSAKSRIRFFTFYPKMHTIGMVANAIAIGLVTPELFFFFNTISHKISVWHSTGFGFSGFLKRFTGYFSQWFIYMVVNSDLARTRTMYPTILWKGNKRAIRKFSLSSFWLLRRKCILVLASNCIAKKHHPFCHDRSHANCIPCAILHNLKVLSVESK